MIAIELAPLGVEVTDVVLADADETLTAELRRLLARAGVVVIRGQQHLDDDGFVRFLRLFGDLMFTIGETPVADHPDLNVISNVGRSAPPRSTFHVDTSYVSAPPRYTALRAVQVPARGGATQFSNQYRAYDRLPRALHDHLDGRTVTHIVTGVDPGDAQETRAEHPLFRTHPVSGHTALYLTTPARCAAISGLDEVEAERTIALLYAHSTAEHNVYRHAWRPDDVVMWDNGCVMHRADHADVIGDRVMHRGMVAAPATP